VCGDVTTTKDVPELTTITEAVLITSGHTTVTFATGAACTTSNDRSHSNYNHHLHAAAPSQTIIEAGDWHTYGSCCENYAIASPLVILPLGYANLQDRPAVHEPRPSLHTRLVTKVLVELELHDQTPTHRPLPEPHVPGFTMAFY